MKNLWLRLWFTLHLIFYWSIGLYQLDNNGAYKKSVEDSEFLEDVELTRVAKFYDQQAQVVMLAFKDFTKGNTIPELIEDKPQKIMVIQDFIFIYNGRKKDYKTKEKDVRKMITF